MSTHKNLMTVCCAAVLAFGLAACGSSSDDNGMPAMPADGGMPDGTMVTVDLTNVTAGTTAEAVILDIEAGMSGESGNTAFACAAGGDDCTVTVTVDDDGTVTATSTGGMVMAGNSLDHQKTIDDAAGPTPAQMTAETLAEAEKALTDASTDEDRAAAMTALVAALKLAGNEAAYVAYLEKQIVDQAKTVADAAAKERLAERIARAAEVETAIGMDRVGDMYVADLLPADASGVRQVVPSRAAGKLTVDVNGPDEDDVYAGGENTAGSSAWNYVMMTKTDAASAEDTVVIYTDIAAPADVQLTKHYDLGERTDILRVPGSGEEGTV